MKICYINNGNVFFLVEIDGQEYPFNYPVINPEGETVEQLTGQSNEFFQLEMLKNLYPDSPVYNGSIEDWERWIAEGCFIGWNGEKLHVSPIIPEPYTKKQVKVGYIRQYYDQDDEYSVHADKDLKPEKWEAYQAVRVDAETRCTELGL